MAKQEDQKAEWERQVFSKFAVAARLPLVADSVRSRQPPEPDILCALEDRGQVAFELVNLVDEDLMRMVARSLRGVTAATSFGDPTMDLVTEKLVRKNYVTPHPMELLAYGDDTLLPYDVWAPSFEQRLRDLFDRARKQSTPSFQRLWVVNLGRRFKARPVWLVHPNYDAHAARSTTHRQVGRTAVDLAPPTR